MRILLAKSLIAGLLTSIGSLVVLYLVGTILLIIRGRKDQGEGVLGWDPVAALTPIGFFVFIIAMFLLGAFWAYRKSIAPSAP